MCWVWARAGFTDTLPPLGDGHLNKSLQCSEVSANWASVMGGAPGGQSSSFFLGKGSRQRRLRPVGSGLLPELSLKARAVFIRQARLRLLWRWQQPLETQRYVVSRATSLQVLGTGPGRGRRDTTWGGRRGGDMLQPADPWRPLGVTLTALWLLVPRWLSKAGPRPSAGGWGRWGRLPAVCLLPAGYPTIICWFELYPPKWHCLRSYW